ncbi:DNA mismatch repair protein MSH4, partial [Paragonimus westermani]
LFLVFILSPAGIVEGRGNAAGEIGIAAIDLFSPNVELSQFRDTSSYSRTLVKLLILCPNEIIVPHSALERSNSMQKLFHVLQGFRTTSPILGVHRAYFNDKQGLADLRRYCHPDYLALIYAIKERFYSLAAAASLFHYVEESYAILHAPCSLKFTFTGSIQTTMIDFPTIMQRQDAITELASAPETLLALQNILRQLPHIDGLLSLCVQICRPPTEASFTPTGLSAMANSSHSAVGPKDVPKPTYQPNKEFSLKSGARDPSTNDKISARAVLPERISWSVSHCNESSACKISLNPQTAETRITRVIAIKNLLDLVPVLHNALRTVRSGLLTTYKELLSDPGYDNVLKKLCTVLHNDVRLSKGMLAMRSQKCFAIKEGINVILDVTRKAYSEQLDDVTKTLDLRFVPQLTVKVNGIRLHEYISVEVGRLARKLKLPLRVAHNKIRGFYIQFPEASLGVNSEEDCLAASQSSETQYSIRDYSRNLKDMTIQSDTQSTGQKKLGYSNDESAKTKTSVLPPELIKPLYSRGVVHCTTESLIRLNERMKGSLNEVYFIADQIICDLIVSLQPEMSLFYRLSEVVASLDLLASFARLVVSSSPRNHFTYPKFTDRLAIKNGRNIVLEHQSTASIVPNHTYTSKDLSLTILTGPNMSGKTTYLRQIAYIQILAQVGSLVPAEFASVRMMNQIFYHSSGADDLVSNDSSFTKEMKEMSYALRHSTDASLVLIDGLCQSTNPREAIGLIWAICEALLEKKVFTFLATQFPEITQLANFYSNVQ